MHLGVPMEEPNLSENFRPENSRSYMARFSRFGDLQEFIEHFLFCSNNRNLYKNPRIRPTVYKILENFDLNFRFFWGVPDIFRPRNINLWVEIFNLVPSMLNLVHFSAISWPSKFPTYAREPPSGTYGLYAPQQKRNCHMAFMRFYMIFIWLSATALAVRACFHPLYPCFGGLFSVHLRTTRTVPPFHLTSFFQVFLFAFFLKWLFSGFCGQHGLNMPPTWNPRDLQNR